MALPPEQPPAAALGLDLLSHLLEPGADRRIFSLADPLGGTLRLDPAEVSRRIDRAEDDEATSFSALRETLARVAGAVEDGTPRDDPGVARERRRAMRGFARLGHAAFERRPFGEDPGAGWTEAEAIEALFAFVKWESALREEARPLATFVAAYGWPRPGAIDYRAYWGLRLNLPRIQTIPAAASYRALLAAQPGAAPDLAIADALGTTASESSQIEAGMIQRQATFQMASKIPR
jgi:hypothetical protein